MHNLIDNSNMEQARAVCKPGWKHSHAELQAAELSGRQALRLNTRHVEPDPSRLGTVIWLPPTFIERPSGFELDVHGTRSGCELSLLCVDEQGWGFSFDLGADDHENWRTMKANPNFVSEAWGSCHAGACPKGRMAVVGILVRDFRNERNVELGIAELRADAEKADDYAAGSLSLNVDSNSGSLAVSAGSDYIIEPFSITGLDADSGKQIQRSKASAGFNSGTAEFLDGAIELESRIEQVSPSIRKAHFNVRFTRSVELEKLQLRAMIPLMTCLGTELLVDDAPELTLDGRPSRDSEIIEPLLGERITLATPSGRKVTLQYNGDTLKEVLVKDCRLSCDYPAYAIDALLEDLASFSAGDKLDMHINIELG